MESGGAHAQTISQITALIRSTLESRFDDVQVEGEVSNFRPSSTGHWYFSLKDDNAALSCVMFRGLAARAPFKPADGQTVRATGNISVYAKRGVYQLAARTIQATGQGNILAMLEERKRRLAAEGVFDRARALPAVPRSVAVVTSPTGAAVRDFVRVLATRDARLSVRIVPVPVQGESAAVPIARAITVAAMIAEVVVVTRGGGSVEDLLPFSDEAVVRAIAACPRPVISAIGHEVDWALSDFAADRRAPTPSAAAEIVAPRFGDIAARLSVAVEGGLLRYPERLERLRERVERVSERELTYRFRNFAQPWYQRIDEAARALKDNWSERLRDVRARVRLATERTETASPYSVLERGYAIARDASDGRVLTRATHATAERTLTLQFADGTSGPWRQDRT